MTNPLPTTCSLFADSVHVPVADNGIHRTDLLNIANSIHQAIHPIHLAGKDERLWLVAVHEPVRFAAAVIACWQSGVVPVLSADLQPDTLSELSQSLSGILTDKNISTALPTIDVSETSVHQGGASTENLLSNPTYPTDNTAMVLFTSGSSGKKKQVVKPFFALFEEVKNLEATFGTRVSGLPAHTTVSHFHIYGFLFNILWPLHAGHLLSTPTTFYWEQILQDGDTGARIVSSPAHLRVLASIAPTHPFNWQNSLIFSSGGPLDHAIAIDIRNTTGQAPIEIFGSTETGGIGHRQQSPEARTPFTPFEGVSMRTNNSNGLEVMSPWLHPQSTWMETGDRIALSLDGTFFPEGRYDTVVKIAGKRISLTEMETVLCAMPEIEKARVFQYCDEDKASRAVLAAVVVPTVNQPIPAGPQRQQFIRTLKQRMRRRFDLVALPRYWRFVLDFPRNTEGKVPLSLLMETVRNGR